MEIVAWAKINLLKCFRSETAFFGIFQRLHGETSRCQEASHSLWHGSCFYRLSMPVFCNWSAYCQARGVKFLTLRRHKMSKLVKGFNRFVREEDAPTMVEYGLMVALIAVACIAAAQRLV